MTSAVHPFAWLKGHRMENLAQGLCASENSDRSCDPSPCFGNPQFYRYILCWTKHEAPFQPTVSLLFLVVISNFKLVTYLDIYLQILQVVSPSSFSVQTPVLLRLAVLRLALHCNGHSLPSGHGRGMNPSIPVYTCQNGILAIGEYLRYYVNMYCMQYSTH